MKEMKRRPQQDSLGMQWQTPSSLPFFIVTKLHPHNNRKKSLSLFVYDEKEERQSVY
jgi:hypothetical protein